MSQPSKLLSFTATPHPLGGEVELTWTLPTELPAAWKLYVFKRRDKFPEPEEIQAYLEWLYAGANGKYNYDGLFVMIDLPAQSLIYSDFGGAAEKDRLKDQVHYYYKAVIYDKETGEYSDNLQADAIPEKTVKVSIIDGKDIVAEAITRILDGQVNEKGEKVNLKLYVEVVKHLPSELVGKSDFIMISRSSGETQYHFFDNYIGAYKDGIIKGEIDVDLIEVNIYCVENPDRRDTLVNIIRGYKHIITRYCKKKGAIEALVGIGGDSRDPGMNNGQLAVANFHVAMLIENQARIDNLDLLPATGEIKVTNE